MARWTLFYDCLLKLKGEVIQGRGASVAENRNNIVKQGLKTDATHFFFLDDDLIFAPDVLDKLLARDLDAVVGLSLYRCPPFEPLLYKNDRIRQLKKNDSGLIEVDASTSGGLLIKREVFEKMESPYWTLGQIKKDKWGDDIDFCRKLKEAGYKLFCDLDVRFGHIFTSFVLPEKLNSGWTATLVHKNPFAHFAISQ